MLYDITPRVSEKIHVWPGDTPLSRRMVLDHEKGDHITLSALTTTLHLGAHADGANHYERGGSGVGEMPLEHYLGRCHVVRAQVVRGVRVRLTDLNMSLEAIQTQRVLIRTGTFPDFENWNSDFAGLEPELVETLAEKGVITVGIDTPSVDLQDSKDLLAHKAFAKHKMAILEGLVLENVPNGEYELIALPLRLMGMDASPVRAVLRTV